MNEVMKFNNRFEKAVIPDKTPLEEIELLNATQASKLTHIERHVLIEAMDKHKASKGRLGLAYIVRDGCSRRLIRRVSIRRWLEDLERRSLYV